jgi:hypothetical protein
LNGDELDPLDPLSDEDEMFLTRKFEADVKRTSNFELAGIDRYGADLKVAGERRRVIFDAPKTTLEELEQALVERLRESID